jgi:hypothetical protein
MSLSLFAFLLKKTITKGWVIQSIEQFQSSSWLIIVAGPKQSFVSKTFGNAKISHWHNYSE